MAFTIHATNNNPRKYKSYKTSNLSKHEDNLEKPNPLRLKFKDNSLSNVPITPKKLLKRGVLPPPDLPIQNMLPPPDLPIQNILPPPDLSNQNMLPGSHLYYLHYPQYLPIYSSFYNSFSSIVLYQHQSNNFYYPPPPLDLKYFYESNETKFSPVSFVESILNNLTHVDLNFLNDTPKEFYREYIKSKNYEFMFDK